jgi:hypothetical protein
MAIGIAGLLLSCLPLEFLLHRLCEAATSPDLALDFSFPSTFAAAAVALVFPSPSASQELRLALPSRSSWLCHQHRSSHSGLSFVITVA